MYIRMYVCTYEYMHEYTRYTFIHIHTNVAQVLAASVLGTTIEFYKRRHVGPT